MKRNVTSFFTSGVRTTTHLFELGLIVCALIVFEWIGLFEFPRKFGEQIARPARAFVSQSYIQLRDRMLILRGRGIPLYEYQELRQQYTNLLVRVSKLEQFEAENQVLKEALGQQLSRDRLLSAPIITANGTFVGLGSEDGVELGESVLAQDVLVGIVTEVSHHQSRITPLQQLRDQPLLVRTETDVVGLVVGSGKSLLLTEVARDAQLTKGMRVLTAGQEGVRPGMLIGTVREVELSLSAPTLTAILDQPSSLYEVPLVSIW